MVANRCMIVNVTANGQHEPDCFCNICRNLAIRRFYNQPRNTRDVLHQMTFNTMPHNREQQLEALWEQTKSEIVIGYSYKLSCLNGTGYRSYGAWLNQHHPNLQAEIRKQMCDKITQITTICTRYVRGALHYIKIGTNLVEREWHRRKYFRSKSLNILNL